ncbi:MAG TPA: hypothetical protein VLA61_21355 [Ideonella sp.]|uniref:hypothetical protein n=1 Tax=Ideonella sp. TaxID=1929293 RepID=UPI002C4CDEB9|nr:hypothetical protein [Ideonella sp.]HSI50822.1 hypothetical protein [Ideonella sp.]
MRLKYLVCSALGVFPIYSGAVAECTETVTQVFNHSNGNVYFATDQTCAASWCQLSGNADFVKRGYAMLTTAQLAGKKITFKWPNIAACTQNALYSSPEYMWTAN